MRKKKTQLVLCILRVKQPHAAYYIYRTYKGEGPRNGKIREGQMYPHIYTLANDEYYSRDSLAIPRSRIHFIPVSIITLDVSIYY